MREVDWDFLAFKQSKAKSSSGAQGYKVLTGLSAGDPMALRSRARF